MNLPVEYSKHTPQMLVLNFHGFYDDARYEVIEDNMPNYVNNNGLSVVTVYPAGSGGLLDGGDSFGWNVEGNGLNLERGPRGSVCETPRYSWYSYGYSYGDSSYSYSYGDQYTCYSSCSASREGCDPVWGCNFASCMDDRAFVKAMLAQLVATLCVDLDQIHLTGISAGGLMAYQTALDLSDAVASVVPVAGSRIWGYARGPEHSVSLMDWHGFDDTTVPANRSNGVGGAPLGATASDDHFYYHQTAQLTTAFAAAAQCDERGNLNYATRWDNYRGLSCNRPHGRCGAADVVQCVGHWGHTWPLHETHPMAYAALTLDFMTAHPKVRPAGASPPAWLFGDTYLAPLENKTAPALSVAAGAGVHAATSR